MYINKVCPFEFSRQDGGWETEIEKWLRNKNTIEFLGIWEEMYNPDFNSTEFGGIKNEAGTNRFLLSVKQWVERTNSRGIMAKAGRYGGTYAQKDIAFEFALWVGNDRGRHPSAATAEAPQRNRHSPDEGSFFVCRRSESAEIMMLREQVNRLSHVVISGKYCNMYHATDGVGVWLAVKVVKYPAK